MGFVDNKYKKIKPIKQVHRNSCWAACLEWWQKAMGFSTVYSQSALRKEADIKAMYSNDSTTGDILKKSHKDYGVLEKHELLSLLGQPRFTMNVMESPAPQGEMIDTVLGANGPIIIGYYDGVVMGNHLNVICGYDSSFQFVEVMEPRTGKFVEKGLSEFLGGADPNVLAWKMYSPGS
ncbi:MAG: hypothetical protein KF685_06105 [Acidobacteria bacterium]|nr:hypothetical protein [Acidobacteriota bacterium]